MGGSFSDRPRILFLDTDDEGQAVSRISETYGRGGTPVPPRSQRMTSVAEMFADDKIGLHLPEYARIVYEETVPIMVREEYNQGLARVMRWKGQPKGRIVDPDFQENDLDHVTDLLDWANEIEANYPLLWRETCDGDQTKWLDLLKMLAMHDAGEVEKTVLDLDRAHPDFHTAKGRRHKKKEARVARLMLKKYLPESAAELITLYNRFDRRLPEDKLVMLGHVLDKGQAGQKAAMHVVPFNLGAEGYDLANHSHATAGAFLEWANHLAGHLSEAGRKQLGAFLTEKIMNKFDMINDDRVDQFQKEIRKRYENVFPK